MAIRTLSQIRSALIAAFKAIGLRRNEIFWSDEDQYASFIESVGREPNKFEMYGTGMPMGGMCQSGPMGEYCCDKMADVIRNSVSDHAAEVYLRESRGHIFYFVDNIARCIYEMMLEKGKSCVPFRIIQKNALANMAHERRHEVQPKEMFDATPVDGIGTEKYLALRHEADADAFMYAVLKDEADVHNPAAWEPERLIA